ncbi:hypothetical protein IAT38_007456 [Cryptococcus sp. DSM 104549]
MYHHPPSPAPSNIPLPSSPINTNRLLLARRRSATSIDTLVDTIDPDAEGVTLTRSNRSNRTFGPSLSDMEDNWGLTPEDDGEPDVPLGRMFYNLPTPSMSDVSMHSVDDLVTPVESNFPGRFLQCSACMQTLTQKDGGEQATALFKCSSHGCEAKFCSACAVSRITGEATGCKSCGGPGLPIMAHHPTGTTISPTFAQYQLEMWCWSKILETTIERFRAASEYRTTGRLGCLAFYIWIGKAYVADSREFPLPFETLQAAWEEKFGDYGPPSRGAEIVETKSEDGPPSRDEENEDPRLDPLATFDNIFLRVEALYEGMHAFYKHPQGKYIIAHIQAMTDPNIEDCWMTQGQRQRFEHDLLELLFNHTIRARRLYSQFRKEGVLHPSVAPQGVSVRPGAHLYELMHALECLPPDFNTFNYMFPESDDAASVSPLKPRRVLDKDATPGKTRLAELRRKELESKALASQDENLTPLSKDLFRMFDEWQAAALADEPHQHAAVSRWLQAPGAGDTSVPYPAMDVFGPTAQDANSGQDGWNAQPAAQAQFWQPNPFMPYASQAQGLPVSALQHGHEHSEDWYVEMSKAIKELVDAPPTDTASGQSNRVPSMKAPWDPVGGFEQAQEMQDVFQGMLGEDGAWLKNGEAQGGRQNESEQRDSGVPVEDTGVNPFITQQLFDTHNSEQSLMTTLQPSPYLSPHTQSTIPARSIYFHEVDYQFPTYYQYIPDPPTVGFASRKVTLVDDSEPPKTPTRRGNLANSRSRTQFMARLVGPSPHVPKLRTPSSNHQTPRKARSTSSMHLPDEKARTPRRTMAQAIAVLTPGKTNGGGGGEPMESPAKRKFMELWRVKGSRPGTSSGTPIPIHYPEATGGGNKENRSPVKGQRSQLFKKPSFLFGGGGEGPGSPSRRGEKV